MALKCASILLGEGGGREGEREKREREREGREIEGREREGEGERGERENEIGCIPSSPLPRLGGWHCPSSQSLMPPSTLPSESLSESLQSQLLIIIIKCLTVNIAKWNNSTVFVIV